jgi:diguanylate cyclase (GGDEF)-like protein
LNALGRVLRPRFTVLLAADGEQALALLDQHADVAAVLADLRMPGLPGGELLARVAARRPHCRRAVVTAYPDSDELITAINAGHLHYVITKPWKLGDLEQVVDQLVHMYRLECDNARLIEELRAANHLLREHERALQAQLSDRGREISLATERLAEMGLQLDALALRDPLTGLYTHRAFQERLREEVARALRYGQPMSLLIADLDQFASVNYALGYQAGDEILRRVARILQDDRSSDIVARYSGEEFVLLLPETSKAGALTKAARLGEQLADIELPGNRALTLSIGVACLADDAADPEGLLTAAEAALRGAVLDPADIICRSGDGDGYLIILAPRGAHRIDLEALAQAVERAVEEALAPMVTEVLREQPRITVGSARVLGNSLLRPERLTARLVADASESALAQRTRKAHRDRSTLQDVILGEGLTSVYQPIVDLGTGDIFAYEALTRGPRGTQLESPATLFAIAEDVDLTVELDRACFRGALRSAQTLEPVHRLFVNLLPMSFYDTAFIEVEVGNLLSSAGLTPANIVFEITERLAIENFASFKRALHAYTAMGFGIAIDDVGTRHSNLETVMSLRPHFIKISDVLVRGIARSTVKREMLRSLRHIAETIDAVMVAEGIEHVEDVAALRDLGLRYGQGYYMARPGPAFPTLPDAVRAELRTIAVPQKAPVPVQVAHDDDSDDDDERDLAIPMAAGSLVNAIPPNAFGREDEVTSEVALSAVADRQRPRASEPPAGNPPSEPPALPWQPLKDDEATGEALLSSLRSPPAENAPADKPGTGRPGLN